MSDVPDFDTAGLPEELSAVDQLMHRGEANPRTRSGIMGVELLDVTPDWERYRAGFEQASRKAIRLRQKVVMPSLPTAAARWVVDPDFNLDYHVRRVRAPGAGTLREVFDFAELALQSPLDISRPLWTATLVEGLPGGGAANIVHMSHAVTDGIGSMEMFANLYDLERDPAPRPAAPLPIPEDLSPNDLTRQGINALPKGIANNVLDATRGAAGLLGRMMRDPADAVGGVVDYVRSSRRVMTPAAPQSPVLRRRGLASRSEAIDIKFSDLHKASKAAEGSINDAYLAALCGALRRYHDAKGIPVASLPMAVPVNVRSDSDPAGGNRFAGVNIAAPIGVVDPRKRIQKVRAQMTRKREERAIEVVGVVAPLLNLVPDNLLESMAGSVVNSDVQASNVPGPPVDTFIAGAKVLRHYGIGPLPGVAMMAVLISRSGWVTISTRYDRASINDPELWARCLLDGFNEVLALGGDGRAIPASFELSDDQAESAVNGGAAQ